MADVTPLLDQWRLGDRQALETLIASVYRELKKLAQSKMRWESGYHTLQPTALVHECFFRLAAQNRDNLKNRDQFFALAARIMRRILMDHARAKNAQKRGGDGRIGSDSEIESVANYRATTNHLALDEALVHLAKLDPELCMLVELKHFGGFGMDEISQILGRPQSTVYRQWKLAKAHLFGFYQGGPRG